VGTAEEQPVGVVLAGGSSRRMGRHNATIELGGASLVARAVRALSGVCADLLVADGGRRVLAGSISVADGAGSGPAAGILGAAAAAPGRSLLVLACDLPAVPSALLELLASAAGSADWVVPRRQGRLEPLCALYGRRALAVLAEQVARGVLAPHRLAERADLAVRYLEENALADLGDPETMFANVNRPGDLRRVEGLLTED
jgi:molybdopterin-guanine dinucleotide biosynthesis protein A